MVNSILKNEKMKIRSIIALLFLSPSLFAQLDYEKFTGEQGKISFNKEYSYANIYDYQINASKEDSLITRKLSTKIPEGLITELYSGELMNNAKDSISFEIIMKSRLLVDMNNNRVCFIKYKTRSNTSTSEEKIFKAIRESDNWTTLENSNTEIELLEQIVLGTSVNMLFQFYNYRDDAAYKDLNKLKPQVKNEKGVLNIKKLAEVIANNKTLLEKYISD